MKNLVTVENIAQAMNRLKGVVKHTITEKNTSLSSRFGANIYLKREDLQIVRSYKIRGAYNYISSCSPEQTAKGIVCASAGNHAQGVAFSCKALNIQGTIFMPGTTPKQKVNQVKMHGGENVTIKLIGDTFDDSFFAATAFCDEHKKIFVHPFDQKEIIEGQGTVGIEILNQVEDKIDYLFLPIGGGGFASGVSTYFKKISPETKIIGVEPEGAPAMKASIEAGKVITLQEIEKFVDGAAVKKVGNLNYAICKEYLDDILLVPEGQICSNMIRLYNEEAIVVEPAGALALSALSQYKEEIEGKNVVCVISGGNNDLNRMQEVKERSLMYEGLKHYFIIRFPQRAGALREFVQEVLGPNDDITRFEFSKKNSRESGPALVGVELQNKDDYKALIDRMKMKSINYTPINESPDLFEYFV